MEIRGMEGWLPTEVEREIAAGGRFVFYEYCISLIVVTLRRPTAVYFLQSEDLGIWAGLPYAIVSLLFGWWGVPWGFVYPPLVLYTNLTGGRDVTQQMLPYIRQRQAPDDDSGGKTPPCDASL
jgi:hypothetical protein